MHTATPKQPTRIIRMGLALSPQDEALFAAVAGLDGLRPSTWVRRAARLAAIERMEQLVRERVPPEAS